LLSYAPPHLCVSSPPPYVIFFFLLVSLFREYPDRHFYPVSRFSLSQGYVPETPPLPPVFDSQFFSPSPAFWSFLFCVPFPFFPPLFYSVSRSPLFFFSIVPPFFLVPFSTRFIFMLAVIFSRSAHRIVHDLLLHEPSPSYIRVFLDAVASEAVLPTAVTLCFLISLGFLAVRHFFFTCSWRPPEFSVHPPCLLFSVCAVCVVSPPPLRFLPSLLLPG